MLPPLTVEEYEELRDDIDSNGQRVAISLTPEGQILSGRYRERACLELGIAPRYETVELGEDPLEPWRYVMSVELYRRHLAPVQRGAALLAMDGVLDALRAEAQARSLAGAAPGGDPLPPSVWGLEPGPVHHQIARLAGCAPSTAQQLITVAERKPEDLARIARQEVSLNHAYKAARAQADDAALLDAWRYEYRGTPPWVVLALAHDPAFQEAFVGRYVRYADPFAGMGEIPTAFDELDHTRPVDWILGEIRSDACSSPINELISRRIVNARGAIEVAWGDFFALTDEARQLYAGVDCFLFNPPFSRALEAVEQAWALSESADVIMLQRVTWVDEARASWLREHQPLTLDLPRRVRFIDPRTGKPTTGTDNCGHAWYWWPAHRRRSRKGERWMLEEPRCHG